MSRTSTFSSTDSSWDGLTDAPGADRMKVRAIPAFDGSAVRICFG